MSDYVPRDELRKEVDRFFETNTFTPMLVTGFYMHARCVLNELAAANQRIAELEAYADKLAVGLPEGMLPKDIEVMRDANAKFADENARLRGLIARIYTDLPSRRDWLDPVTEAEMKDARPIC